MLGLLLADPACHVTNGTLVLLLTGVLPPATAIATIRGLARARPRLLTGTIPMR
jgi:hypothetical protein